MIMLRKDISYIYFFDHASAAADRFEAEADIGADKGAVGYKDIAGPAGHFAADDKSTVRTIDDIIADDHVLRRPPPFTPVLIASGFDADAVVSRVEGAVLEEHAATGFHVDAIAIGGIPGVADVHVVDRQVFA